MGLIFCTGGKLPDYLKPEIGILNELDSLKRRTRRSENGLNHLPSLSKVRKFHGELLVCITKFRHLTETGKIEIVDDPYWAKLMDTASVLRKVIEEERGIIQTLKEVTIGK